METYIQQKKELYQIIIDFLENEEENECDQFVNFNSCYENIQFHINLFNEKEKLDEQKLLLYLIVEISNSHRQTATFNKKIEQLLSHFFNEFKQTLTNSEIFEIFKSSKRLLLFLFQNHLLTYDDNVKKYFSGDISYCHFFYPDIKSFFSDFEREKIEDDLRSKSGSEISDDFEKKRKNCENDSIIATLIRTDSIEEFIVFINKNNISLSSKIKHSIYETNTFLNRTEPSLIEYACFYGSIQIYQFLRMNQVQLNSSLWLYSIHSNNAELIHLLESDQVQPNDKTYEECLIESIKCHHNNIAKYIETNLMTQRNSQQKLSEKVTAQIVRSFNFFYFEENIYSIDWFFYLCRYNYANLVNIYSNAREEEIKLNNVSNICLFLYQ